MSLKVQNLNFYTKTIPKNQVSLAATGGDSNFINRYKTSKCAVFEYEGMRVSLQREHQGARHAIYTKLEGNSRTFFARRIAQADTRKYYIVNDCF